MFDYLDIVKTTRPLTQICADTGEESVPAGAEGTIVMVHDERVGHKITPGEITHYEVEFTDNEGDTIAIMSVGENDLELVKSYSDKAKLDHYL